jgi:signal peptidase II
LSIEPRAGSRLRLRWWLGAALGICLLDQLVKHLAGVYLSYGVPVPVMPGFNLTLLHNTGAAFSLLDDAAGWQRWLFSGIAVVVGAGVTFWLWTMDAGQRWAPLALTLILGGALGNLIDRLYLGYVVDFIEVYYGRWSWPAFNVADSAISVGAVMLIIRGPRHEASADTG